MHVLIAPVGEQATPNLIPIFAAGPGGYTTVQFLISDDPKIRSVAENLRQALKEDKQTSNVKVPDPLSMDAWDLKKAREDCARAITKYSNGCVTVNLTGGTKIMSLGAYQAACATASPMVYVNTEAGELIRFDGHGARVAREAFTVKIPIGTQLRAAGREFNGEPQLARNIPHARREFVKWLVDNYDGAYERCLKRIVAEMRNAHKRPWLEETELAFCPQGKGLEVLQRLAALNVVTWNHEQCRIQATNKSAWGFLNGGWVEAYALIALDESGLFDQVLGNVNIKGFAGDIDVMVTRNGRLGIVECKTKGPYGEGVTAVIAKIRQYEAIFGGPYARAVFALASDENIRVIQEASEQFGIGMLIYGRELRELARAVCRTLSPA
ncbi:MAG: DUF1887 family protein [bacterium]|uniref:DUF1887 family protein n=1 Tax=Candidatus Methylomirabilis tolerans TaxID=3123416 RepID=A0AAJ1AJV7_9BACT|nr:DUF1887 family protein [Candidatus Methylomirabilis sp.]